MSARQMMWPRSLELGGRKPGAEVQDGEKKLSEAQRSKSHRWEQSREGEARRHHSRG